MASYQYRGIRLGDTAPTFDAHTTKGNFDFHTWKAGSWAILFSHPADFTPVCTTELGAVARLSAEWEKRGVKVIGLSTNELGDHEKWIADIDSTQSCSVQFPIIADKDRKIAVLYDMLDHQDITNVDAKGIPFTVRSVFIIDPKNIVRLILTYPASCGRNFNEILRTVDALQLSDKQRVTTPAGWNGPQDEVIIHPSVTNAEAEKLFPGYRTVTPYLRVTKLPDTK
ncbi:peroxiredoxin [Synchytrium microbalum]|uniref:Peroxiredoxin n=1 Tax=Synchytrium microbalum TaxID=1806994 RepID=A0A507BXU7_9FUNG|nr:peroxiredoxin [Synchytrium microbalum]TPX30546.1 peroxiredoxin [Synchytrium microbalum]